MRNSLISAFVFALLTLPAFAHDEMRVVGTVVSHSDTALVMKTKTGDLITLKMDKQTVVTRDKQKVGLAELKEGATVVVDGYGDDSVDLLALEVRLVPAIAPAK